VTSPSESLPTDLAAAHAMIIAERAARLRAEAVAASAKADAALVGYLKLEIEKLRPAALRHALGAQGAAAGADGA
jgi:transposase